MIPIAFNSFLMLLLCAPAVTLVGRKSKLGRSIAAHVLLGIMVLGAVVGVACWSREIPVEVSMAGFAPLTFALAIDRLSAFFLVLICVVSAPVVLFSSS